MSAVDEAREALREHAPGLRLAYIDDFEAAIRAEYERWAVFEDEDHAFMAVIEATGDYVWWPEMTEADVRAAVDRHNAALEQQP